MQPCFSVSRSDTFLPMDKLILIEQSNLQTTESLPNFEHQAWFQVDGSPNNLGTLYEFGYSSTHALCFFRIISKNMVGASLSIVTECEGLNSVGPVQGRPRLSHCCERHGFSYISHSVCRKKYDIMRYAEEHQVYGHLLKAQRSVPPFGNNFQDCRVLSVSDSYFA